MKSVCVRVELLLQIKSLVDSGKVAEASKLLDDICDIEYRQEVNKAKKACYTRFKAGLMPYEEFRKTYDELSSCLP